MTAPGLFGDVTGAPPVGPSPERPLHLLHHVQGPQQWLCWVDARVRLCEHGQADLSGGGMAPLQPTQHPQDSGSPVRT